MNEFFIGLAVVVFICAFFAWMENSTFDFVEALLGIVWFVFFVIGGVLIILLIGYGAMHVFGAFK